MSSRRDLWSLSFVSYKERSWGFRKLGVGRYAIDLGYRSFILELWWKGYV